MFLKEVRRSSNFMDNSTRTLYFALLYMYIYIKPLNCIQHVPMIWTQINMHFILFAEEFFLDNDFVRKAIKRTVWAAVIW